MSIANAIVLLIVGTLLLVTAALSDSSNDERGLCGLVGLCFTALGVLGLIFP